MNTQDQEVIKKERKATADLFSQKIQKIEDLQSALRACLVILCDGGTQVSCEPQRLAAIEQAQAQL